MREKDKIITAATDKHKKLFAKQAPAKKYLELYRGLFEKFKTRERFAGQLQLVAIFREQTNDDDAIIKKHVITAFLRRYNVRMRSCQRNRSKSKEAYRDGLMKWHSVTREQFIRTGGSLEIYYPKWGCFKPSERFNVDQTLCHLLST